MAGRGAGPSFIEAGDGELLASIPSASMEYHLLPRKFPRIDAFSARVDSSLGTAPLPEHEVLSCRHLVVHNKASHRSCSITDWLMRSCSLQLAGEVDSLA